MSDINLKELTLDQRYWYTCGKTEGIKIGMDLQAGIYEETYGIKKQKFIFEEEDNCHILTKDEFECIDKFFKSENK